MTARRMDRDLARSAAEALDATVPDTVRSVLHALPVMIHTSGLDATGAYLLSRAKGDEQDRYWGIAKDILAEALRSVDVPATGMTPPRMLDAVVALDEPAHSLAERRARAFAGWLARIGDARAVPKPASSPGGRARGGEPAS